MTDPHKPPNLVIVLLSKVGAKQLSKSRGDSFRCLVSIGEPGEKLPGFHRVPRKLRLEFTDITDEAEQGFAPRPEDVSASSTLRRLSPQTKRTLIHRQAGVSRSTAAAYIILASIFGPGRAFEALNETIRVAPHARPNRLMIRYADDILGRRGRLLELLAAHLNGGKAP